MKKFIIIGILLLICGITLGVYSLFISGDNFDEFIFNKSNLEKIEYFDITSIEVESKSSNVLIKEHNLDSIVVYYNDAKNFIYKYEINDNKLEIEYFKKWSFITSFFEYNYLEIYIPENISLKVINASGNTSISSINTSLMDLESFSGNIKLANIKCINLNATVKSGNIVINNSEVEEAFFKAKSGNITSNESVINKTKVEANSGNIVFKKFTSSDINCSVDSGNIVLNIYGSYSEYKVSTYTKSGNCNIKSSFEGDKLLVLEARSGNITVKWLNG